MRRSEHDEILRDVNESCGRQAERKDEQIAALDALLSVYRFDAGRLGEALTARGVTLVDPSSSGWQAAIFDAAIALIESTPKEQPPRVVPLPDEVAPGIARTEPKVERPRKPRGGGKPKR